jgi:hypothetical protein
MKMARLGSETIENTLGNEDRLADRRPCIIESAEEPLFVTFSSAVNVTRMRERGSKANQGFLYSAGCLTTSSQKTHSDGFLYSRG